MKRTPNHFSCKRGKRVYIKLSCGKVIVDKFVEKLSRAMVLREAGRVAYKDIAVFKIHKE